MAGRREGFGDVAGPSAMGVRMCASFGCAPFDKLRAGRTGRMTTKGEQRGAG
jgi:hypothetical protein